MSNTISKTTFIDSHFHFSAMQGKQLNIPEVVRRMEQSNIAAGIDIAVDLEDTEHRLSLLELSPNIAYSLGLYPSHAEKDDIPAQLEALSTAVSQHLPNPRFVALGEFGLDYHWNYGTREHQRELYEGQLRMAETYDLPIIIHNRLADEEILEGLQRFTGQGIMHCFSSGPDIMRKTLDRGMYISFSGNLTFKNSTVIQDSARQVPLDRVLFETDAPYLTPVPHRGRPNTPVFVEAVYRFFAEIRGISIADLQQQVWENFNRVVPRYTAYRG